MDSIFDERACSVELQAFVYRNVRNGYAMSQRKYIVPLEILSFLIARVMQGTQS
jgi:hypothetical protein